MSQTPDPSLHDENEHVRKIDQILRDEDVLSSPSAADAVDLPSNDSAEPGQAFPQGVRAHLNTPAADEELAPQEAFEAGVRAAEDESRKASRTFRET